MGNISSGHFKKSKDWQVFHNADERPNYAIGGKLEVNRNGLDALNLKNQIIQDAKDAYERNRKPKAPKFRATEYEWSLVVNLKELSTMQDLEKLSKHFSDKYGFQCYQIAIHRDEGHIDDNGQKIINHHAHLEFITLDKETGKSLFRADFVKETGLRIVQDEIAEILQMERGVDRRLSGVKRIEPRAWAAMKEAERAQNREKNKKIEKDLESARENIQKAAQKIIQAKYDEIATLKGKNEILENEILTQKQINERFSAERKAMIECGGHTAEGYKAMTALKNELKAQQTTNQQLEQAIKDLRDKFEKEREAREKAEKEAKRLQEQIKTLPKLEQLSALEGENNALKEQLENKTKALETIENAQNNAFLEFAKNKNWVNFYGKVPNKVSDLIDFCDKIVDYALDLLKEKKSLKQEIEDLKNNTQNDMPTSSQNDDSNTTTRKMR